MLGLGVIGGGEANWEVDCEEGEASAAGERADSSKKTGRIAGWMCGCKYWGIRAGSIVTATSVSFLRKIRGAKGRRTDNVRFPTCGTEVLHAWRLGANRAADALAAKNMSYIPLVSSPLSMNKPGMRTTRQRDWGREAFVADTTRHDGYAQRGGE